jgi:hypothetical protein
MHCNSHIHTHTHTKTHTVTVIESKVSWVTECHCCMCACVCACACAFACVCVCVCVWTLLSLLMVKNGDPLLLRWWIDWVKKLGSDVHEDLHGRSPSSPFCPADCVFIQIGQVGVISSLFVVSFLCLLWCKATQWYCILSFWQGFVWGNKMWHLLTKKVYKSTQVNVPQDTLKGTALYFYTSLLFTCKNNPPPSHYANVIKTSQLCPGRTLEF